MCVAKKLGCIPHIKAAGKLPSLCFHPLCLCSQEPTSCSLCHHSYYPRPDGPWQNHCSPQPMALHLLCASVSSLPLRVICWSFMPVFTSYLKDLHVKTLDLLIFSPSFSFFISCFLNPMDLFSLWGWQSQSIVCYSSLLASSTPDFSLILLLVYFFSPLSDNLNISGSLPLGDSWTSLEIYWLSSLEKYAYVNKYYFS